MGKRRSWFGFVKRLFIPEAKPKQGKKFDRWRWLCGRQKLKRQNSLKTEPERTILDEAKEQQKKHVLNVAIATAAAAEAAVAAASAAAEIVRLTGISADFDLRNRYWAAIKIQSVYRGHLARKALAALKGVVKLQAVVRGQIVRQQIIKQLKILESITKPHSKRIQSFKESCENGEKNQFHSPRKESKTKVTKLESYNWDYNTFPDEDKQIIWLKNQEASTRRERMKRYSSSLRDSRNGRTLEDFLNVNVHRSNDVETLEGYKTSKLSETEMTRSTFHLRLTDDDKNERKIERLRNAQKQHSQELISPSVARRSFCRPERQEYFAGVDETSLPNSPSFPAYMAETESAKARKRSMSTPKQRLAVLDLYSANHGSSCKPHISAWSSLNGEFGSRSQHITMW